MAENASEMFRLNSDLESLAQLFFNANQDRLNRLTTRLSVLGTVFVTFTLVTGFFGQNFKWMTDHIESGADFLVLGIGGLVIPAVVLGMLYYVKRNDWF